MGTFHRRLNQLLDQKSNGDNQKRAELVARMARAAGISPGTTNGILNERIDCPPPNRVAGFARVLGVSAESLERLKQSDGCEEAEKAILTKSFKVNGDEVTLEELAWAWTYINSVK